MRYFLLFLFLAFSYNVHGTNLAILEEVTNKLVIKDCKPTPAETNNFSSNSFELENSSSLIRDSLPQSKQILSLNLEGKLSKEDINCLGDSRYKTISLHRAYSQKDFPCLKDNCFILSPSTFNRDVQDLRLRVCGLTDEHIKQIGQFKKLETLKLHSNMLTEKGVGFMLSLTQLKTLDLGANNLNDSSVEKLLFSMTNLSDLDISGNKGVTGKCLNFILNNKCLKKLNIKMTSITREEFKDFKKHSTHLTKLDYFPRSTNY